MRFRLAALAVLVAAFASSISPLRASARVTRSVEGPNAIGVSPASARAWSSDLGLQDELTDGLRARGLGKLLDAGRLAVSVADLASTAPRYAGVNDDKMFYAASLPKVAILLGAFDAIEKGQLRVTPGLRDQMTAMIRVSSNRAATAVLRRVGFENVARVLQAPSNGLYEQGIGGLWVGKSYGESEYWRRDPVANMSHGATALHAARFFVLLDQGRLVSPRASAEMKKILGDPGIRHKFVRGLDRRPGARIFRKSGSWRNHHADAALVERDDSRYVVAALADDEDGGRVLEEVAVAVDDVVRKRSRP